MLRTSVQTWCRQKIRQFVYGIPTIRDRLGRDAPEPNLNAALWNKTLAATPSYLGGTISVAWRNAILRVLIDQYVKPNPAVLDIGCASGILAKTLSKFEKYTGVDVSPDVIDVAARNIRGSCISFEACDIRTFEPKPNSWDAIVFAEVLYYLSVTTAAAEVERFVAGLRPGGMILVSMKDDGKSAAIFFEVSKRLRWIDGILWQAKSDGPHYKIRSNRERPAYLVGVLSP